MSKDSRKARFGRLLRHYGEELDQARANLAKARLSEQRACEDYDQALSDYERACQSTFPVTGVATACDLVDQARWREALSKRCDQAYRRRAEAAQRCLGALDIVQEARRRVKMMENLVQRIDQREAVDLARREQREEDAFGMRRGWGRAAMAGG